VTIIAKRPAAGIEIVMIFFSDGKHLRGPSFRK